MGSLFIILGFILDSSFSHIKSVSKLRHLKNLTAFHHFDCYHPTQATVISHLANYNSFLTSLPTSALAFVPVPLHLL